MKHARRLAFFSLLLASTLSADNLMIDKSPWLGRVFEFEAKGIYEYEKSTHIQLEQKKKKYHTHLNTAGAGLLFTAHPEWDIALQLQACETKKNHFAYDSTKAQVRHVLLNDFVGDPVSAAVGVECSLQQKQFLKDMSIFHHADFESLFFASVGKEFEYRDSKYLRTWAMGGIGVANKGSSWTHTEAHVSLELTPQQVLDLALDYECGNGHRKLHAVHHFPGYAHLAYYVMNVGLAYRYNFYEVGSFFIEAKKRVRARYCPSHTTSLLLGFDIPFSLL